MLRGPQDPFITTVAELLDKKTRPQVFTEPLPRATHDSDRLKDGARLGKDKHTI